MVESQESDLGATAACGCFLASNEKTLVSCCKNCMAFSDGYTTDPQDQANSRNNSSDEHPESANAEISVASGCENPQNTECDLQDEECDWRNCASRSPTIFIIVVKQPMDNGEVGPSNGNNQAPGGYQNFPNYYQNFANYPGAIYPAAEQSAPATFHLPKENYIENDLSSGNYLEAGAYNATSSQNHQNGNLPNVVHQSENHQIGPNPNVNGASKNFNPIRTNFEPIFQLARGIQLSNETDNQNCKEIDIGVLEQTLQELIPNEECLKHLENMCKKRKKKKKKPKTVFDRFTDPPFVIEPKQCVNCCNRACHRPCCYWGCNSCYPWC